MQENKIIIEADTLRQEHLDILSKRGTFTDDLKLVTGVLPPTARITSIEIDSTQITIEGEANNRFAVVSYATALEEEGSFPEVRIDEINEKTSIEAETKTIVPSFIIDISR